jgi:hypothetical protein
MPNSTTKPLSTNDFEQAIQYAFNDADRTLAVGGFVSSKVGHNIQRTVVSPTVDNFSYYDNSTLLYTLQVTYDTSSHTNVNSVVRIV